MLTSIFLILISSAGVLWLCASAWDRKDAMIGGRTDVIILIISLSILGLTALLT